MLKMIIREKQDNGYVTNFGKKEIYLENNHLSYQTEKTFILLKDEEIIAEIKMLFNYDQALAVLTVIKTLEKEKKKKKILKEFLAYLFDTIELPFSLLKVKCEQVGSGFSIDTLELSGFINDSDNSDIFTALNPNYMQIIMKQSFDHKPYFEEYFYFQQRNRMKLNHWNNQLKNTFRYVMNSKAKMNSSMIQNHKEKMKLLSKKIKQYSFFTNYDIRYLEEYMSTNKNSSR